MAGYFKIKITRRKIMNLIEVSHVSKSYGEVKVVDDVSFCVQSGECFGLLGHNGAGKSTLIESILGLKKVEGHIKLLGVDMSKRQASLFQKVGAQLQESAYQDKIKVIEVCQEKAVLYKCSIDLDAKLREFNLESFKDKEVSTLSGGEKQRLSIMLASIHNPDVLFLDELTTGLDAVARREVWKFLLNLKKQGKTLVLTSHFMDEVEALCDRVLILDSGKEIIQDTLANVIANTPYDSMEKAYLWYMGEEELI